MNSVSISPLFCSETNPKYHLIIAGGIPARESAMTGGSAGFDIILCNVMYETELGSIPGHFSPINSVEFFPDGRGFISGSEEGITKVFRFDDTYWDDAKFE
jgi:translation initiation factor 3 subunit I